MENIEKSKKEAFDDDHLLHDVEVHTHGGHLHFHSHAHPHHNHAINIDSLNKAFIWGIVLNSLFVVIEFVIGFLYNSVGLISDAGHNLSDIASLILAMLAFRVAKIRSNQKFTYGYKKMTIIVSLINAVILLAAVAFIVYESIQKIIVVQEVEGGLISITAAIGVLINGFTAWLFLKDKEKDLNVKGAYLHMAADCLVSVGVVVSGMVIIYTGWYWIDGIIGLVVAAIIVFTTMDLLKDSLCLALDGVPKGISVKDIAEDIHKMDNVEDIHHIHIWAISTTENAMTAHVFLKDILLLEQTKHQIKHYLKQHNISHSTLEFEFKGSHCGEKDCNCHK